MSRPSNNSRHQQISSSSSCFLVWSIFTTGFCRPPPAYLNLLRGNPRWPERSADSFLAAKPELVAAVPLTHPTPGATLALALNASDTHVGPLSSNWKTVPGGHWLSTPESRQPQKAGIPPSTVNCWPLTPWSSIFFWRVKGSVSSRNTNR
jgi:hypothetical protein